MLSVPMTTLDAVTSIPLKQDMINIPELNVLVAQNYIRQNRTISVKLYRVCLEM